MKKDVITSLISLFFSIILCSITMAAMPDELVLYMSFDSGTIGNEEVTDLSKYGNNGTIVGDLPTAAGYRGDALDFASSASVEIVTSESLATTIGVITMEAWIYTGVDGTSEIISKWDNAMNGIIHFEARGGGNMRFCMRKEDDSKVADFTSGVGGLEIETWVHVAEVYDGSDATIYYDGVEIQTVAGVGEMRENEDVKWWIGSMYATDRWFKGMIDEVRIWNKALTPDEIQMSIEGTLIDLAVASKDKLTSTWGKIKD